MDSPVTNCPQHDTAMPEPQHSGHSERTPRFPRSRQYGGRLCLLVLAFAVHLGSADATTPDGLNGVGPSQCGALDAGAIEPRDYFETSNNTNATAASRKTLAEVEARLFPPAVASLNLQRVPITTLTNSVDQLLRLYPNHPRGLWAISSLEARLGTLPKTRNAWQIPSFTADCFFERAFRFKDSDADLWVVLGMHLHGKQRLDAAAKAYAQAASLGATTGTYHYNHALLLADLKRWDDATREAQLAYNAQYLPPGLEKKFKAAGKTLIIDTTPPPEDVKP